MALVGAALVPAGSSGATRVRTVKLTSLNATGSLTYTWSGDPARGCAAVGVCGIHGELILFPQPTGQNASPGGPVNITLDGSAVTRVIREVGGAALGECADASGGPFGAIAFNLPRHGTTNATVQPPPSSGRCAGPTGADLAGVSVPVRRTGRSSFDLTGTRPFTAGPFSGTLVSTVRLAPAPAPLGEGFGGSFTSTSSGPGHPVSPAAAPIMEFVQLRYRVSAATNAIQTQFSGTSSPACQILDACGTSGSLAFSVAPSHEFTLIGSREVHRRLSRREILNNVRAGRLRLGAFALLTGRVSEAFNWPDGTTCRDAVATPSLLLSTGAPTTRPAATRTIPVTVSSGGGGVGTSAFRTRCPGPDDEDLFGAADQGNETYARGSITPAQLLGRRLVLRLSEPGSFSGLGYAGSRTGAIVLELTLIKVTARTQR